MVLTAWLKQQARNIQVIQKVLSVAMQCSQQQRDPASWQHMTVSTESFFRTVSNVTGQEVPTFLEHWIYGGGHPVFAVRKKWLRFEVSRRQRFRTHNCKCFEIVDYANLRFQYCFAPAISLKPEKQPSITQKHEASWPSSHGSFKKTYHIAYLSKRSCVTKTSTLRC